MKKRVWFTVAIALIVAIWGWNPFSAHRNTTGVLAEGYGAFETGVQRQPNGVLRVRALTRMPNNRAQQVKWWFADYMQTSEHYKRWHPQDHVWMDWENKVPGEIVGASHLVHEYIGGELQKLRIQFVPAEEILGEFEQRADRFVLCARAGELEQPINAATMCHIIRDMPWGAEMRSVFWMGHVAKRASDNPNQTVFSIEGLIGNTALGRWLLVPRANGVALLTHCIQEMGTLADFLPELYRTETNTQS